MREPNSFLTTVSALAGLDSFICITLFCHFDDYLLKFNNVMSYTHYIYTALKETGRKLVRVGKVIVQLIE